MTYVRQLAVIIAMMAGALAHEYLIPALILGFLALTLVLF